MIIFPNVTPLKFIRRDYLANLAERWVSRVAMAATPDERILNGEGNLNDLARILWETGVISVGLVRLWMVYGWYRFTDRFWRRNNNKLKLQSG